MSTFWYLELINDHTWPHVAKMEAQGGPMVAFVYEKGIHFGSLLAPDLITVSDFRDILQGSTLE